ncbi:MAG TPA: FtsQ-type POTRA domain-containing protein [Bryobacteraceae bacterium]|nr:FtsQ-type POTRA domain-containing protein [Bryobacteraceae bacterium]
MAKEQKKGRVRWRMVAGVIALALLTASAAMATLKVRRFVNADPQFSLSRERPDALEIEGLKFTARAKIFSVFAGDFDRSVFAIPLEERRSRLREIDWVEDASISRLWPDRVAVRIRERRPVAFVLLHPSVLLIDGDGVLLEQPPQSQFAFPVLSGIRPQDTLEQRRDRVHTFLRVEQDLGYLAKDVSEIDTGDTGNIRVVAQADNRAVELLLGDSDFGRRYQNFLNHYPEIRKRSPEVKRFDLRLDDRITARE